MQAEPNAGHLGLAKLQLSYDVIIITQNVDDLHERAGSENVLHLHGELMKSRSSIDPDMIYDIDSVSPDIHIGDSAEDGSQLRPYIVWFGEPVPMMEKAIEILEKADVLIIIGTSLNVYPAAALVNYVKNSVPIYLIDPNDVSIDNSRVHFLKKGASEGISELCEILEKGF